MNCPHTYKRPAFGIGEKTYTECILCGWREETGNIVVSADRIAALEARCREREEYAAKLEQRTDKSLTEHAAGCIADQERIAQLEVIARDVYNGFKKEAWEGANEYFNEHPEVTKHYGSPKETTVNDCGLSDQK